MVARGRPAFLPAEAIGAGVLLDQIYEQLTTARV
jgi:hypothetical protein